MCLLGVGDGRLDYRMDGSTFDELDCDGDLSELRLKDSEYA